MTTLHERLQGAVNERLRIAEAAAVAHDEAAWATSGGATVYGVELGPIVAVDPYGFLGATAFHIAANDPARIIRDCQRDLRVLQRHRPHPDDAGACFRCTRLADEHRSWPCDEIKDLCEAYQIDGSTT